MTVELLTRVSVEPDDALLCRCPGCNRRMYADVHVLRLDGEITVYGSSCYRKFFGEEGKEPLFPWKGEKLTAEQRQLLEQNTEAFIASYVTNLNAEDQPEVGYPTTVIVEGGLIPTDTVLIPVRTPDELKSVTNEFIAKAKSELRRRSGIDPEQAGWSGLVTLIAADLQAGTEPDWSWLAVDLSNPRGTGGKRNKQASDATTKQALADMFKILE